MSVFPITLPLYPILNASEAVEKLLAKDAEAAKTWPSEEKTDAEAVDSDTAVDDIGRPAHQIVAVEGSAAVMSSPAARSGAAQLVSTEVLPDLADAEQSGAKLAEDGYVQHSEAVRSDAAVQVDRGDFDSRAPTLEDVQSDDALMASRLDKRS
ncbi:MAG: hypothetical protein AAFP98_12450 [Pseudomonadota bacterium]